MNTQNKELLVIKVGSNTLKDQNTADWLDLDYDSFRRIGSQATEQRSKGKDVVIVSSAAAVAGYSYSRQERTKEMQNDVIEKQRMACLGQSKLMTAWDAAIKDHLVAQVLLTQQELEHNDGTDLKNVMQRLFEYGDIPVVNENDAQSHKEIVFGDNDKLAAHVIRFLHKTLCYAKSELILLSDIHGVYEDRDDETSVIKTIRNIEEWRHVAGKTGDGVGTGGMQSKFEAAQISNAAGIDMYIANGRTANSIQRVLDGEIGTHFVA